MIARYEPCRAVDEEYSAPDYATLADETIASQRDDNRMAWTSPSQISPYDCRTGDDGLSSQNDVLRTRDGSTPRDFIACVLWS